MVDKRKDERNTKDEGRSSRDVGGTMKTKVE
jgi:hypothetical protein